ncbi:MAG: hypothetical protein NT045_06200, partial [Candidatus Aureabacteria bacterium]|nr:hypothetical protein [Candidatus Auribacterota bacterium]
MKPIRNIFMSKMVGRVIVLAGSVFATLIALEALIRLSGLYPHLPSQDETLFEYHDMYGWQFIPNKYAREVAPGEFEAIVKINSAGMRNEECSVKKAPGGKRIAVLGDSFVSNLDVESADVFTAVMEGLLPPRWEVLNFGVNGFGPTQEYLLLAHKVIRYEPDIVIMCIYPRNDFDDIVGSMDWIKGYARPKARLDAGGKLLIDRLPTAPPPVPDAAKGWHCGRGEEPLTLKNAYKRSLLYHFVRDRIFYNFNAAMMPEVRICAKKPSRETAASAILMKEIIKETHCLTRARNSELLVVIAPTMVQVYEGRYWPGIKKRYHLNDEEYDLFSPNKYIRDVCAGLGVLALDLTPALSAHAASGARLYYPRNQHWNREGNRLVA